jgi:hypothetical protein
MAKHRKPNRTLGDDSLLLTGFALEAARHLHGRCPTKEEVEELRHELAGQEDTLSDEDRRSYREIGYLFSASKRLYRYTAQVEWMKFLEN